MLLLLIAKLGFWVRRSI